MPRRVWGGMPGRVRGLDALEDLGRDAHGGLGRDMRVVRRRYQSGNHLTDRDTPISSCDNGFIAIIRLVARAIISN